MEQKQNNPLGYAPIGKLLKRFAIPAIISMLVTAIYNIVDQIFIGQGVGYLGNAATTVAFPIVTIMLAIGTCIGVGGGAYAAIKLGEKNEQEAEQTLGNQFMLLCVFGVLISALGLIFLEPMLKLFGATESVMAYSKTYTGILLLGAPFNMLGISLSHMARTDGSPTFSMYSILAGALLNVILDPIYIFVFHWGVAGAAIATITSQIISCAILIVFFLRKSKMRLRRKYLRVKRNTIFGLTALGTSSAITQLATTILLIVLNNVLVYYGNQSSAGGDVALSAMGIVSKINMILVSACVGIGVGAQPILGFNKGAGNHGRIRETYLKAIKMATIISVIGWLCCMIFPYQILSLFGTDNVKFTFFAVRCMRFFLSAVFCAGFQIVSTSYFQATGQPVKACILSMLRPIIILVPMLLILPFFLGLDGVLYAGPIADFGTALIIALFVLPELKKLKTSTLGENYSS